MSSVPERWLARAPIVRIQARSQGETHRAKLEYENPKSRDIEET